MNLALWNSVQKTPLDQTKKGKIGGHNITSIAPQYLLKKATEHFGSIGYGFGMENERYEHFQIGDETLCNYFADFWYLEGGVKCTFPMVSSGKLAYVTNSGKGYLKVDQEIYKKVQTNAMSKALSKLGFGADVFLGMFEDDLYMNSLKADKAESDGEKAKELAEKEAARIAALPENQEASLKQIASVETSIGKMADKTKKATAKAKFEELKGSGAVITVSTVNTWLGWTA